MEASVVVCLLLRPPHPCQPEISWKKRKKHPTLSVRCNARCVRPCAEDKVALPSRASQVSSRPSKVELVGRRLYVNGAPYFVRGVNYNPIPKGEDGQRYPYGDYFTPPYSTSRWFFKAFSTVYTESGLWHGIKNRIRGVTPYHDPHLAEISKTFNTVRIYNWQLDKKHTEFLDLCQVHIWM